MSRKSRRESLTFELTPLIDVVFLLLIFFMVSSVFKKEELALMLNLPKTEKGKGGKSESKIISIEMNKEEIAYQGSVVTLGELADLLKDLDKKSQISLRVDGQVVYDRLVEVLDLLQKNKLENLSLITQKKSNK